LIPDYRRERSPGPFNGGGGVSPPQIGLLATLYQNRLYCTGEHQTTPNVYWFDFGDDWFHQVDVERIEQAIPTVTYPRVIRRVGKSPPQYTDQDAD
jgi:hypothetical protein